MLSDLVLAVIGNPRIGLSALRHVTRRRARIVESGLRLAETRVSVPMPREALARSALLKGLSGQFGVLLLSEEQQIARIGVAEVDMLSVLYWLCTTAHAPQMRIGKTSVTFGTPQFKSLAMAAQIVRVSYVTPDGNTEVLAIEAYFRQGPSRWVSPNPGNVFARALYDDRLETPGLSRLQDLLGGPCFAEQANARPVDVVYTWVNHADPDWAKLYATYKRGLAEAAAGSDPTAGPVPKSADATAMSRFHSNDELRYSLRSVADNLTWVRQIYVLTNCAPPDWLKLAHPGIRWVQHEDVIPADYLPTFSSHVIESFLHRIPGLADHFIYINDDVFIASPLPKSFFFDANGGSQALLEPYGMISGTMKEGDPDYLNASRNSAALIRETFGFVPTQLHRHTSFALRRDVLAEMEARWPDIYHALRQNRFRTGHDVNITSFLYHHYGLATGRVIQSSVKNAFVKSQDIRWKSQLSKIAKTEPEIICINDGGDAAPSNDWHGAVRDFLHRSWPASAPWER